VFYSIIAIGMFMGIPIGVIILGIAAGLYIARKIQSVTDINIQKQAFKKTAYYCAAVMGLMCCLITLWAIAGKIIGYKLDTPLLSLTFTVPVFIAIVLSGSFILVLLQYFLTNLTAKITFRLLSGIHTTRFSK
jgi:CHASE2 domain-containing sensor protein